MVGGVYLQNLEEVGIFSLEKTMGKRRFIRHDSLDFWKRDGLRAEIGPVHLIKGQVPTRK